MDAPTTPSVRIDHHRRDRVGFPEVIYAEGKSVPELLEACAELVSAGESLLVTRITPDQSPELVSTYPDADWSPRARVLHLPRTPAPAPVGCVVVASAGTSDTPVAEEAALTAEACGARVQRMYDVGVAGLHRILDERELLERARAIVVVAGMDGALPAVVSGLVGAPVIAVPTSVGYGAAFEGIAPLLSMLNACAPGVSVVNIDNGFGAGYLAAMINRRGDES